MVSGGWMNFDGTWKLCKYATGEMMLFNLDDDPHEQHNRYGDPACWDVYQRLDTQLTQEIMTSIKEANYDRRVDTQNAMWSSTAFGQRGWRRTYPQSITS